MIFSGDLCRTDPKNHAIKCISLWSCGLSSFCLLVDSQSSRLAKLDVFVATMSWNYYTFSGWIRQKAHEGRKVTKHRAARLIWASKFNTSLVKRRQTGWTRRQAGSWQPNESLHQEAGVGVMDQWWRQKLKLHWSFQVHKNADLLNCLPSSPFTRTYLTEMLIALYGAPAGRFRFFPSFMADSSMFAAAGAETETKTVCKRQPACLFDRSA